MCITLYLLIPSVQFSHIWLFETPWTTAHQASLPITNSGSLLKLMCTESVMPSNHLILCCPLLLPPSIFPSIRVFSNESILHQVAKVLEFQLQHQSFQWIFRTDLLQDGLVGSPCSPRASQESSPTPQFKSIDSSALSLLYGPPASPLVTAGLFSVYESASVLYIESLVLFFRFHVCGITYHLSFSAWQTWLGMISSRSIRVAANGTGVGLPKARV